MVDGSLNFNTKIDSKGFDKGIKNINSSVSGFSSKLGALKTKIVAVFSITAIAAFGKKALETAASVNASNSAMSQSFGELEGAASAAVKRVADSSGILETRLKSTATGIYAFAKTSGMDSLMALNMMEEALQVAADSAAYYDRSLEDTSETLKSFLKGNYANDAALGLSVTETTRNAAAMKLYGKSFQKLSEAQKQLTLLQMVKDANDLSGATGQAAREADGWENVIGNLKEAWKQLIAVIGQPVLKLAIPIVESMTMALQRMTEVASAAWKALQKIFGWEDADAIRSAAKAEQQLTTAVEETSEAQKGALAGFDEIQTLTDKTAKTSTASAGADTGALSDPAGIAKEYDKTTRLEFDASGIEDAVKNVQDAVEKIKTAFGQLVGWVNTNVKPVFGKLFEAIAPALPKIQAKVKKVFSGTYEDVKKVFSGMKTNIETIFANIGKLVEPLGDYFTTQFPPLISSAVSLIKTIVFGLLDSFNLVFGDIIDIGQDFSEGFVTTILPFLTEFGTEMTTTVEQVFEDVKKIFDSVWEEGIAPFFKRLTKYWNEAWKSVKKVWDEHGEPIFKGAREAFKDIGDKLMNTWENCLKPIWDGFMKSLDKLWENHLKPLWDNILKFGASLSECLLAIYNNALAPLIDFLMKHLFPGIVNAVNTVWEVLGDFLGIFADAFSGVLQTLTGFTEFLAGVFTLDLDRAQKGLEDLNYGFLNGGIGLVEGFVNIIIDIINGLIRSVAGSVEIACNMLNSISFDIPDWVPGIGGNHFGFNLSPPETPQIPKLSIPRLAAGAVIPPNREFLAVLGDQTQGTNIEAPLETIKQAFREALVESGGSGRQISVVLQVGRRELARTVVELSREEQQRVGMRIRTV